MLIAATRGNDGADFAPQAEDDDADSGKKKPKVYNGFTLYMSKMLAEKASLMQEA